jgi:SWI/SNF-related matrix-associated actin-dependent regulator of chromatin subfamily A member 5
VSAATGKTETEIEKYATVFFKRYQELSNSSAIADKIEKGDRRVLRSKEIRDALDAKVQRHAASGTPLTVVYGMQKGHLFSEDEDAFLILMLHKHGYGSFDQIRAEILQAPEFLFDWFIKSRTILEIQKRCDVLVRIIEKENNEYKSGKKRGIVDTYEAEEEPDNDDEVAAKKKKGKK